MRFSISRTKGSTKKEMIGRPINQPGWDRLVWLERFIVVLAIATILATFIMLVLWLIIFLYLPSQMYFKVGEPITLTNGQILRIKYPNLILADNKPVYVDIKIDGKSCVPFLYDVDVPIELDQRDEPCSPPVTNTLILGLINSKTSIGLSPNIAPVKIRSILLPDGFVFIEPQVETTGGTVIREFVSSSVSDKSPLILLIAGLLSGVGSLFIQYRKDRRDRQSEKEKHERDELDKDVEKFNKNYGDDPTVAVRSYVNLCLRLEIESSPATKPANLRRERFGAVIFESDWEAKLRKSSIDRVLNEEYVEAGRIASDMIYLDENQDRDDKDAGKRDKSIVLLKNLCDMGTSRHLPQRTPEEINCLLENYELQGDEIRPLLSKLINIFLASPENLPLIKEKLTATDSGRKLLRTSRIKKKIDEYLNDAELPENIKNSADEIRKILVDDLRWRDLWPQTQMRTSPKIKAWLENHIPDLAIKNPFGSELGELDVNLDFYKINHPALEQSKVAEPTIVFGAAGMGKTTTAMLLKNEFSVSRNNINGNDIFPIYVKLQQVSEPKTWLVESISRALINFISDNPRNFLNSSPAQQTALGRLMLWQARSIQTLWVNLQRSEQIEEDGEQILAQLKSIHVPTKGRLNLDQVMDLLYKAVPAGFDPIYFFIDVSPTEDVLAIAPMVKELKALAISLVSLNIYIKIFTPLDLRNLVGNPMFREIELNWSPELIKDLIERRADPIRLCNKRKITNPYERFFQVAQGNPRKAIKFGNALLTYAEQNLSISEKLDADIFNVVESVFSNG